MAKTPDYFVGKNIVITGAASGIGRETALIFAREGANVVCADIGIAGAEATVVAIESAGSGAGFAVDCDVTKRDQVVGMVAAAAEHFGRVHFQFNSAGSTVRRSNFSDIDDDLWQTTFDVNAKSVFLCMQAVLPHMLDNDDGVIVNVASGAMRKGGPGASTHYAAAKGAVNTLTMGVAREFVGRGIRCLSISPAAVETPFQVTSSPELIQRIVDDIPMGRFGRPDEIGELVLFLCSDACEFMTADTVNVSGGGGCR